MPISRSEAGLLYNNDAIKRRYSIKSSWKPSPTGRLLERTGCNHKVQISRYGNIYTVKDEIVLIN